MADLNRRSTPSRKRLVKPPPPPLQWMNTFTDWLAYAIIGACGIGLALLILYRLVT